MDYPSSKRRLVLMSIRPQYSEPIFAGTKRVEFRRRCFRDKNVSVLVYSSSPVQMVEGWLGVRRVVEAAPSRLWKDYADVGGISREMFRDYFDGCALGFAIEISSAHRLDASLPLRRVGPIARPPQSYQFLPAERGFLGLSAVLAAARDARVERS